ncbi:MAG TPA: VWA domain-containing protein [Terriglobales bacterium]|nr:VWA domain-containing protein [Terriglobales bacterium]
MRQRLLVLFFCPALLISLSAAQRKTAPAPRGKSAPPPARTYSPMSLPGRYNVAHAYEEGKVEFKSETVLVQVPMIVSDKAGTHVHGLGRADFTVLEDGKPQKIATFEEIEPSRAPLDLPKGKTQFVNLAAAGDAPRSIVVFALDTVNTPYLDQYYGRKQLIEYLADHVASGQVLSLVLITSRGVKVIHDFTADPGELIKALQNVKGEIPTMQGVDVDVQAAAVVGRDLPDSAVASLNNIAPRAQTQPALEDFLRNGEATLARMQQDQAIEHTMKAFLTIAWSLSGVPGKKSIIWATGGFPFFIDSPAAVPGGHLSLLYERAMQALNDAEISVYPVDVRGLVNYTVSDLSSTGGGSSYARSVAARAWLQDSTQEMLRDFAEMTGGRAFYNSNDLEKGYNRAVDDSSSYYVVGYYLDTSNTKPGWRKLKVKTGKPNLEVRARSGFFVTRATVDPDLTRQSDITYALSSPFDSTGIALTAKWRNTVAGGEKRKVNFGLLVPPDGILAQGSHNHVNLDVRIMALAKKDGKIADGVSETIEADMNADTLAKLRADGLAYNNLLELSPGEYVVRFVVRDNGTGKVGRVTAPLTVN